jgi:hypothetical protein
MRLPDSPRRCDQQGNRKAADPRCPDLHDDSDRQRGRLAPRYPIPVASSVRPATPSYRRTKKNNSDATWSCVLWKNLRRKFDERFRPFATRLARSRAANQLNIASLAMRLRREPNLPRERSNRLHRHGAIGPFGGSQLAKILSLQSSRQTFPESRMWHRTCPSHFTNESFTGFSF